MIYEQLVLLVRYVGCRGRAVGRHHPDRGRVHGAEHGAAVHRLPPGRPQEQPACRGSSPGMQTFKKINNNKGSDLRFLLYIIY